MSQVLQELVQLMSLETIEQGIYRGESQDLGFGAVFGGQVLGQALSAAQKTISEERHVHSLHSYFLRPGDVNQPIVYLVNSLRDGRGFSTRRVEAVQNGKAIFYMSASFQISESSFEHQQSMPKVAAPESLKSELELAREHADMLPPQVRDKFICERPIESRPVELFNPLKPSVAEGKRHSWLRANGALNAPLTVHQYLLAYASDFNFLPTALLPHGRSFMDPKLQIASIDHAMWFHRPFDFTDWILYQMDSPVSSGARGLVRGQFFNRAGEIVASTIQEGLLRER